MALSIFTMLYNLPHYPFPEVFHHSKLKLYPLKNNSPFSPLASPLFLFFFKVNLFICLFLAALGLSCCARAFSSCGEWGLLFVAVHGLLIAVASLVAEPGA